MVTPANLVRMITEMVFVLLGSLLAWAGFTSRIPVDPRGLGWVLLAIVLIYWGARAWVRTERAARTADRRAARIGGASLVLVGCLMIALNFVELRWFGITLAVAGGILIVRGLAGAIIALRGD